MTDKQKSEKIARLRVLVKAIYETPEGGCGCCLHICLDDGNLRNSDMEWCLENSVKHGICKEVAELLLEVADTEEARAEILGLHGYEVE